MNLIQLLVAGYAANLEAKNSELTSKNKYYNRGKKVKKS